MKVKNYTGIILVLLASVLLGVTNQVMAELFMPPYNDAAAMSDASVIEAGGIAGFQSYHGLDTGRIEQYAVAYTTFIGAAGVGMDDGISMRFSVPISGEYTIEFTGSVGHMLTDLGVSYLAGGMQSDFKIEVSGGIVSEEFPTQIIFETNRSPTAFIEAAVSQTVSNLLDFAPYSEIEDLKTGYQIVSAALELADTANKIQTEVPFTLRSTANLEAGEHTWLFALSSSTIATALGLTAMYSSSIISCDLESVDITPSFSHYIITSSSGLNGSINPQGEVYVEHGGSQIFDAVPDTGYTVSQWQVNGSVVQTGGDSYTISNVQEDTEVFVTFNAQASETDPDRHEPNNSYRQATNFGGIVGDHDESDLNIISEDVDFYRFELAATGTANDYVEINLQNNVNSGRGEYDLDLAVGRINSRGNFVPQDGSWYASASLTDTLTERVSLEGDDPGVYYAIVFGASGYDLGEDNPDFIGTEASGYSLRIHGPAQPQDTTPPTPNPSTWSMEPYATGSNSIRMVADTAIDDMSGVEYYFDCLTEGGHDSGWQAGPIYEDTGLSENTEYTYRVRTRDTSPNQNTGTYSTSNFARTEPRPPVSTPSILLDGITVTFETREISFSTPIALSCATSDATIYYTIDGTTPTTGSHEYTGPFTLSDSATVSARGFKEDYMDSDVSWADFILDNPCTIAPSVIPETRPTCDNAGETTFTVNNPNFGDCTMSWTAVVVAGGDWLAITDGSSGSDRGTISVSYSANPSGSSRTGTIRVISTGASANPVDVTIIQQPPVPLDDDTDDDGLPDDWEIQHFGDLTTANGSSDSDNDGLPDRDEYLNGTDPNQADTDGDGDHDGDEVDYGTNPSSDADALDNQRPEAPVILSVSGEVPLRGQIFYVTGFEDPDEGEGDYLAISEWQISSSDNFNQSRLILQRRIERRSGSLSTSIEHSRLRVPKALLARNTTYWIRTRHCDSANAWSSWSDSVAFTTVSVDTYDTDDNGVDDFSQMTEFADTNDNGTNDLSEDIYPLYDADEHSIIGIETSGGRLAGLDAVSSYEIAEDLMPSDPMPFGLFSFRIEGLYANADNPALVDVTFYFPESLPSNLKWYKYDRVTDTMTNFSSNVVKDGDHNVIVTLTDGGPGDADGVVNGVIVDPSGLSADLAADQGDGDDGDSSSGGSSSSSSEGGGGGGCFISTVAK